MGYFVSLLRSWLYKILNFLLGKTRVFIVVLGWFLIISGSLFLVNPEKARNKMIGLSFAWIKGYILLVAMYAGMCVLSWAGKSNGILPKLFMLAGIVGILALYFLFKAKTRKKLTEQFVRIPLPWLKKFAYLQIIIGALMLILQRRIW